MQPSLARRRLSGRELRAGRGANDASLRGAQPHVTAPVCTMQLRMEPWMALQVRAYRA